MTQVSKDDGYIDSFSAREKLFKSRFIDGASAEIIHPDDVVERWIERYRINHVLPPMPRCWPLHHQHSTNIVESQIIIFEITVDRAQNRDIIWLKLLIQQLYTERSF